MKPKDLLARLLGGAATNVAFADAQSLLYAMQFEELRVTGSHHIYGRLGIPEQLNLQDRAGKQSRTNCGNWLLSSAGTI